VDSEGKLAPGTGADALETAAARRASTNETAAIDPKTETTTAKRLKIPQFIPLAMGESDLPKQAAQAKTESGTSARLVNVSNKNLFVLRLIGN
jgi:hypothetical protein